MDIRFDDQVAIVTGAGSGIGRSIAHLLAARGARVLVNDADPAHAANVVGEIEAAGGKAIANATSVAAPRAAQAIVCAAIRGFGRTDILVNNAGISRPAAFGEDSDEDIAAVLAVNFTAPYALMRAVWPVMASQNYGRILSMSSSAAFGSGISGAYAPTKAALLGLTHEAGLCGPREGITVNAIMPAAHTALLDRHPDPAFRAWMRRHFAPDHVAALAAFLVSRDNRQSGAIFTAAGGAVARVGYARGPGILDTAATPETLRDRVAEWTSLDQAEPLTQQDDLQQIYYRLFGSPTDNP